MTTEHFTHEGLNCKMIRHAQVGHWCGYVQVPESVGPVRWTSDYDSKHDEILDAEVDVWGGITYGPDSENWVGFDDAHLTSVTSKYASMTDKEAVRAETEYLAEQIAELREET